MKSYRQTAQREPSGAEIADAFRSTFGSKTEIDEMFAGFEAELRRAFNEAYGRYKETRDKEWGLLPEDNPPAESRPVPPVVNGK